jgi:hypothetical protein
VSAATVGIDASPASLFFLGGDIVPGYGFRGLRRIEQMLENELALAQRGKPQQSSSRGTGETSASEGSPLAFVVIVVLVLIGVYFLVR